MFAGPQEAWRKMKPPRLEITTPDSLPAALAVLAAGGPDARLLAGGQSLVPMLAMRLAAPALLVDLNRISELAGIAADGEGGWTAGSMTRQRELERSRLVAERHPLLAAALPWIAHLPIRNRGTLGGSLAHADPAAELPAVCLASDACIEMAGPAGRRVLPAERFFLGVFETALQPGEILAAVKFPSWPAARRWGFGEMARRRGDFALCGVALTADRGRDGRIAAARIVAFGIGDRPLRLDAVEDALLGRVPVPDTLAAAARLAPRAVRPRSDHHASAEYRSELLAVLCRRSLEQAFPAGEET